MTEPKQANKEEKHKLCGVWKLKRHENLDNFMKAQGHGYLMRKAMAVSHTLNIDIQGNDAKEIFKVPMMSPFVIEYVFGAPATERKDAFSGDILKEEWYWKDDSKQIMIHKSDNITRNQKTILERSLIDEHTMKDFYTHEGINVQMTRIYKRC